jgi:hypothetical protein
MRGDPILSWDKAKLRFKLTGPLYGPEAVHDPENADMVEEESQSLSQQIIIMDWNQPFSKFNVAAGSTITILGESIVQFNSDKPLECMTLIYDKEPAATFNYFSCKTCNTNCILSLSFDLDIGICESCKEGCHAGHVMLPHLLNHRPTWACCYCMKKDLCKYDIELN